MFDPLVASITVWFQPEHYWQLMPWVMALALAVFSLFFEDIALIIGIAILQHNAALALPVFFGLYVGVTGGDMLIYTAGRWLKHMPFIARRLDKPATQRRVGLIRAKMLPMLVLCRAIPASRFPTFLAAGVVRVPLMTYTAISLVTVGAWVAMILFGGYNLARFVEQSIGISASWLLLPLAMAILTVTFFHARGNRYAV